MLQHASSTRRRRSILLWGVIVVSAVAALAFGIVGYAEYYATQASGSADRGFFGLAYDSVRLFFGNASVDETLPKAVQVARMLAFLSWSAAAIKGLFTLARRRLERLRCRLYRDHAIVCGLGRQGLQLVDDLLEQGLRAIVIELDPENDHIKRLRAAGVPVLIGNAADVRMLGDASAKHARFLFAVAGDDKVNIEIAAKAFELRSDEATTSSPQRCAVHIEDAEVSALFAGRPLFRTPTDGFDAHIFDVNRLAARVLLDRHPPDRSQQVHGPDDPPASILVFGTEMLAQEVITQIARMGHYGNKKKPIVRLITSEDDAQAKGVERRRAILSNFWTSKSARTTSNSC